MATAEKISIALPPEMVHIVRGAVATGIYPDDVLDRLERKYQAIADSTNVEK